MTVSVDTRSQIQEAREAQKVLQGVQQGPPNRLAREEARAEANKEWGEARRAIEAELKSVRSVAKNEAAALQQRGSEISSLLDPSHQHLVPEAIQKVAGKHASDAEIKQTVEDVLRTGDRSGRTDDYEKRIDKFAAEAGKLDVDSRARLFAEVLKQDKGALGSWLKIDRLASEVDEGHLSQEDRAKIAEGFAEAYNRGLIDSDNAADFTGFYDASLGAPAFSKDAFKTTMGFLGSTEEPEMTAFREKFATEMLKQSIAEDRLGPVGTETELAMHIALTSSDPNMAGRVFASLDSDERQRVLGQLGEFGLGYERSSGEIPGLKDPLSGLISSVARQSGKRYDDLALEIAKYAQASPDDAFFDYDHKPIDSRAQALSKLFLGHSDSILRELSVRNTDLVVGSGNGSATYAGQNAIELSNLLRATALNPNNSRQQQVFSQLRNYASELKAKVNEDPATLNERQRSQREAAKESLAMLGAALRDGVKTGYLDLKKDEEARKAFIGFIADVALAGLPVSKLTDGAVKNALSDVFANDKVRGALEGVTGEIVSKATGTLTDKAKSAIADALGADKAFLENQKVSVNNFIEGAILTGLTRDWADIKEYIGGIQTQDIEPTRNG
jgi:hypothetical protein